VPYTGAAVISPHLAATDEIFRIARFFGCSGRG